MRQTRHARVEKKLTAAFLLLSLSVILPTIAFNARPMYVIEHPDVSSFFRDRSSMREICSNMKAFYRDLKMIHKIMKIKCAKNLIIHKGFLQRFEDFSRNDELWKCTGNIT